MPSQNNNAANCVLLAPAGDGSDVRKHLDNKGWIAEARHDPLPALAELCLMKRLDTSPSGWGPSSGAALALVVVEPSRWHQLREMLSAARRYVPSAELWTYEAGSLRPIPNAAAPDTYDIPAPERPAISGDEIAMLLDMNSLEPDAPDNSDRPDQPDMDPDT